MARVAACAFVAGLFTSVLGLMEFINPPPFGEIGDMSNSDTYRVGNTVNVAWTPGDEGGGVSLCLYQQNETDGMWFGDMEYLTQNAVDIKRYSWLVGTRKNLTVSNLFYLSVFQEGKGPSDSNSHYFYIEDTQVSEATSSSAAPSSTAASSTSASSTTSNASSASPTSSTTPTSNASSVPTSTPTSGTTNATNLPAQAASAEGFPTAAKIGIGVGIPVALIAGLIAGWLLFRRRKKNDHATPSYVPDINQIESPTSQYPVADQYKYYNNGSYYGANMNEAPPKSPVEMDQTQRNGWGGETAKPATEAVPVRYEM